MEDRSRAVADLIGGLAYGLLRVFQVAAQATAVAPAMLLRERQADFAIEEFERYRILRRRLAALTADAEGAMERFQGPLDAFYEAAPTDSWLAAQVFHYVGDSITTDFAEILGPYLDERTAAAVRQALAGRDAHTAFSLDQIRESLARGGEVETARAGAVAGKVVGGALSRLREALLESDALEVVLGGKDAVKDLVLDLLGRHRARLEQLGLDAVD